jgi:hypothetical protein
MLSDRGTWTPTGDAARGYKKGRLDFELHGERLKGRWHLARVHIWFVSDGLSPRLRHVADHFVDLDGFLSPLSTAVRG